MSPATARPADVQVPPVSALPDILARTSQDISAVLDTLYRSRALLERATMPRLNHTQEKLVCISETTETAAHDLLDGLGRSLTLIDRLSRELSRHGARQSQASHDLQEELRGEVHGLIACVQFQDIVAQQIAYATRVLRDTELRLSSVAACFDTALFGSASAALPEPEADLVDPGVPTLARHDTDRQSLADTIFDTPVRALR